VTLAAALEFIRNNKHLKNIRIDSRQIEPGDIFVALPGSVTDGRNYIAQAIANGATAVMLAGEGDYTLSANIPNIQISNLTEHLAVIASAFYADPSQDLQIIGITGTNGKTSTSHYIAQFFTGQNISCGVMGTLGNGLYPQLSSSLLTTSDCCSLQRQLSVLRAAKTSLVAMEVSSQGLDQGRLNNTRISTAVFTNLSQDHLDYHQDMATYFAAKCRLFTEFKPQNFVVNIDDPYGQQILKLLNFPTNVITYSIRDPRADVYLQQNHLRTPWGSGALTTNLFGNFNASNVLAAMACGALHGLSVESMLTMAPKLQAVVGRVQPVVTDVPNLPTVIVDYAHTPDALTKVLQTLQPYKRGKLFCIFGCGGDRDRSKRPLMLQAALANSDVVVITQDNPRTESPQQIMQDILADTVTDKNITIEFDRATAIARTIANAKDGDVVLIAGKGHEDYQIIGTDKLPFSDYAVAQQCLKNYINQELIA